MLLVALGVGIAMCTRNSMDFCSIRFGSIFRPVDLLMGTKSYPLGLWTRVCFYNTRTREPMDFLNLIQHRAIVILFREFITNLTSLSLNLYFSEPLSGGYGCCHFAVAMFVYAYDGICDFVWCYDHLNIELVIYIYIYIFFCNF